MIKWLTEYQHEAAESDCIVLATVLNPRFRHKFFTVHYPEYNSSSKLVIESAFSDVMQETEAREPTPTPPDVDEPAEVDSFDVFGGSNDLPTKSSTSELEEYLQGRFPINKEQSPLEWWKVGFFPL